MAERTIVMFPGSLGDFLCALPALQIIGLWSSQEVVFIGREWLFEIVRRFPFVSRAISIDAGFLAKLFVSPAATRSEVDVFFSSASRVFSWFGHACPEVQANLKRITSGQVHSFEFFAGQENCHACSYYLRCVGVQEIRCPSLVLGRKEQEWLEDYWAVRDWHPSSRLLIIQPGSGGRKKRWEVRGFAKVARWWREKKNGQVLILLGPAEEQERELWQQFGRVEESFSLLKVATLLNRAELYLGNDSGISHLAGAVGARGVVLFGPTNPQHWRPLGGSLSILQNTSYRARMLPASGISIAEISAEEVIAALIQQGGT